MKTLSWKQKGSYSNITCPTQNLEQSPCRPQVSEVSYLAARRDARGILFDRLLVLPDRIAYRRA